MKNYKKLKTYISGSFFSIIQLIAIIFLIYFGIIVFNDKSINDEINKNLSIIVQEKRAFFLISSSTYFVITLFLFYFYFSKKIFSRIETNFIFIIIPFLSLFYFIFKIIQKKELLDFIKEEYSKESNFNLWWININNNNNYKDKKNISFNSIFTIIQLLISFTGFVFMLSTKETNQNIPSDSLILSTYSYFTEISNLATCLFMLLIFITGNRFFFKNNSFALAILSYISITGIVFSLSFGIMVSIYHTPFSNVFNTLKSVWFHVVNPFFFILYASYLFKTTKQETIINKSYFVYSFIMPSIYGIYVYSLPFFTNVSIYGFVTNMNYNILPYYSPQDIRYWGGWQSVFFLFGIILLFIFVIYISKFLLMKNIKKWNK